MEDDRALVRHLPDRAIVVGVAPHVDLHVQLLVKQRRVRANLQRTDTRVGRARCGATEDGAQATCALRAAETRLRRRRRRRRGPRACTAMRVGVIVTVRSRADVPS
eukprot:7384539-Prymnesium_polylepis.1